MLEDAVFVKTTYRKVHYPALVTERREDKAKKRKDRQVQWMKKMYGFKKSLDRDGSESDLAEDAGVMAWTNALDYDTYMQGWTGLATTHARDDHAMALMQARASYMAHMAAMTAAAAEKESPPATNPHDEDYSMLIEYDENSVCERIVKMDAAPSFSRAASARSHASVDLDSLFSSNLPV